MGNFRVEMKFTTFRLDYTPGALIIVHGLIPIDVNTITCIDMCNSCLHKEVELGAGYNSR